VYANVAIVWQSRISLSIGMTGAVEDVKMKGNAGAWKDPRASGHQWDASVAPKASRW